MPNIGIDTSHGQIRFVWEGRQVGRCSGKKKIYYATPTPKVSLRDIIRRIKRTGGTSAFVTGDSKEYDILLNPLTVCRLGGDLNENNIRMQLYGTYRLLEMMGHSDIQDFILISIDKRISYTVVEKKEIKRHFSHSRPGGCNRLLIFQRIISDISEFLTKKDSPRHLVFVGSVVAKCIAVENFLEGHFRNAIFPPHAEYAGALGALFYGR